MYKRQLYVSSDLGNTQADTIATEINMIMVYVAIIVVVVLTLTSQTYGEIPVLLLTFVGAMILNQGTNFLLGKISFVSNSVTSILQLALSLDYACLLYTSRSSIICRRLRSILKSKQEVPGRENSGNYLNTQFT